MKDHAFIAKPVSQGTSKKRGGMERSPEVIILRERAADFGSLRAVLRDWGYGESEIGDLLVQQKVSPMLEERNGENHQSNRGSSAVTD